jgi:hypothetical protein
VRKKSSLVALALSLAAVVTLVTSCTALSPSSTSVSGTSVYCGDTNYDGRAESQCLPLEDIKRIFGEDYRLASGSGNAGSYTYNYSSSAAGHPPIQFVIAVGATAQQLWASDQVYTHVEGYQEDTIGFVPNALVLRGHEIHLCTCADSNARYMYYFVILVNNTTQPQARYKWVSQHNPFSGTERSGIRHELFPSRCTI